MKLLTLKSRKPIIYAPGIISLVLLSLFCMVYLKQHKAFVHYNALDVATWSPDLNKNPLKKTFQDFLPKRNYFRINLDGKNDADDKIRLDFARLQIRDMLQSKSTVEGVDFHFGDKAKYWTFVMALDICQVEDVPAFAPYENDLYAVYVKPAKPIENAFICGVIDNNFNVKLTDNTWAVGLSQLIKRFWAPGIVFLAMLFFTVRKLYLNLYRS